MTEVPANLNVSSITPTGITVDWTATSGASSYKLDVSTASNFASFVSGYQDLTVNTNSQAVTGLTADSVKTMTQPNKDLPSWAKAMIFTWQKILK